MMIISSDNGLTPKRWQAVIWTNDGLAYWRIYVALGLNDISIKIYAFFNQLKLFENVACQQQPYLFSLYTLYTYIYNFCMEETWEHVSVHWQQGNYQLWVNYFWTFMCWIPDSNVGASILRQLLPPTIMPSVQPIQPWPTRRNGLALAIWHHTSSTILSQLWTGTILHWTAYTWHWRIDGSSH